MFVDFGTHYNSVLFPWHHEIGAAFGQQGQFQIDRLYLV
jgi:hypothetical protein